MTESNTHSSSPRVAPAETSALDRLIRLCGTDPRGYQVVTIGRDLAPYTGREPYWWIRYPNGQRGSRLAYNVVRSTVSLQSAARIALDDALPRA